MPIARKLLSSVRSWAIVASLTATAVMLWPQPVFAYCYPCGPWSCVFPDGICRSQGTLICWNSDPFGGHPGTYLYCHPADIDGCAYLESWGQC
jgi:hypothetical protein